MISTLENILEDPKGIPPKEIVRMVLELAEFMGRSEQPFPLDISVLCDVSRRQSAHSSALYYSESQVLESCSWQCEPIPQSLQDQVTKVHTDMVLINRALNLIDSSIGVYKYCKEGLGIKLDVNVFLQSNTGFHQMSPAEVEMHRDLLDSMSKAAASSDTVEAKLQQIHCLYALSRWEEVLAVSCFL